MLQRNKNKIGFGLLTVFAAQIFLPLAVFISIQYVKSSQEKFVKENFSKENLFEKLTLTENEFHQLEYRNKKEIIFKNNLYDLRSVSKKNGKYTLIVLSDEKEKMLEETGKSATDNTGKENTVSFLFTFLFHESPVSFNFTNEISGNGFLISQLDNLLSAYTKVPTPPPDIKA